MLNYVVNIVKGIASLLEGMAITLKHAFHKPYTVQYPEQKVDIALRFRGRLAMPVDPEKGDNRCTACGICVKACPNRSLEVEKMTGEDGKPKPKPSKFSYDLGTCMFCNLCVEACPFAAIIMTDEYELGTGDKASFKMELVSEKYKLTGKKEKWWVSKFKEENQEGMTNG